VEEIWKIYQKTRVLNEPYLEEGRWTDADITPIGVDKGVL